jgi:crotonobetainyl-CoA:carnitine CoA-transferase CaiB-like acyl-CoA transferase
MSRILAGPSGTQLLADMGAKVIKIERPGVGDDTRRFAPPFLKKENTEEDSEVAAYFAGVNRNKLSVTLNYTKPEGQAVIKRLLKSSDVLVENFKTGTLDKYGLGFEQLNKDFPGLVYCSVTGFGHTGPYSSRPGYDALIQAMGGIMGITGVPDGEPMKVGISMCDLTAGLHGVIGILAALRHKALTGDGQHVDISMLDVTVAMLANQGMNYLATKKRQPRLGNNHPNIVPYQVMPSSDGFFILSVGNDSQFETFCKVAGAEELLSDPKCSTAVARVQNRAYTTEKCNAVTKRHSTDWWLQNLEQNSIGCAPILNVDEVFADPHVKAREMVVNMDVPGVGKADILGSPMKFSKTKIDYRMPPPELGANTEQILQEAGFSADEVASLREKKVV